MPTSARIVYVDLPQDWGKPYSWHPDLGIVQLDRRLEHDPAGRERALDDLQAEWRASLAPLERAPSAA